ncbi:MAG: type II toxin-antitoxin system RelE/ParE family toxin [Flavobacteriaceae bacterium]|nr:type II toxin-antitoxin system RelE/ParE family toxin [Flavobacteriaceae bacterium]
MEIIREIVFYKDYFDNFFETLTEKAKDKIDEVLFMMTILERVPTKFFKSIAGVKGLFEIRVEYESNIYRIFCCLDKGNLVVLFNGFQKKSQKTPTKELNKAKKIMEEYLASRQADFNEKKTTYGNKKQKY